MCSSNDITDEEYKNMFDGYCESCDGAIDIGGRCIEKDDCHYSPEVCSKCGYRPCQSC